MFPSFCPGGAEVRTATIINALGRDIEHSIVALDGRRDAAGRITPDARVAYVDAPKGKGSLLYGLALRPAILSIRPDLLLTYNWGAIDAVIAGALPGQLPIVHAEDGFGSDEAFKRKARRVWARRVLLNTINLTVVPSIVLRNLAHREYWLPERRIRYIPNGVDTKRFRRDLGRGWRSGYGIPDNAVVFGFVGALRPEKRLDFLLSAFASSASSSDWLVIAGDGPGRAALQARARELGIDTRTVFAGDIVDPAPVYAALDVFAMSSMTEQMPIVLLEAMSSALPVVSTDVGDIAHMLGATSTCSVVAPDDFAGYCTLMRRLGGDADLRRTAGTANRQRCAEAFGLDLMIERYRAMYYAQAGWPVPERYRSDSTSFARPQ